MLNSNDGPLAFMLERHPSEPLGALFIHSTSSSWVYFTLWQAMGKSRAGRQGKQCGVVSGAYLRGTELPVGLMQSNDVISLSQIYILQMEK
jgi:hypothetical protein